MIEHEEIVAGLLPDGWVQIPLNRSLQQDLKCLAKLEGRTLSGYAVRVLDEHVNGKRGVLEAVKDPQKDNSRLRLDNVGGESW